MRWIEGLAVVCAALVLSGSSRASVLPAISSQNLGPIAINSSTTLSFQISDLSSTPTFVLQYGTEFSFSTPASCISSSPVTCTIGVKFKPKYAGLRQDAILVYGSDGTRVAITLLHGIGLGPQAVLRPGIITAFAGTGTLGSNGDNGLAINAELKNPQGLAIDTAGNVYIADSLAMVVRKVDTTGNITTVAGNPAIMGPVDGGLAINSGLNVPLGLAVDGAGNLYIADSQNNRIRRVDALTYIITTVAGNGTVSTNLGDGSPATTASLNNPTDVAVDPAGNLYIADQYNNRIRRVDAGTGVITTVAGGGTAAGVDGFGDGLPAVQASLSNPGGVSLDSSENLYIADMGHNLIREVSNGMISAAGGTALQTLLNEPSGVRVDAAGNVYIADTNNSLLWQVNGAGMISVLAGQAGQFGFNSNGVPADLAQLNSPAAVAIDPSGNIYIADQGSSMVRKIVPGAAPFTFPATNVGAISVPQAISIDNIGNQALSFSAFGLTGNFVQQSTGSTDCSLETTLPAASSCSVAVAFAPQALGPLSGLLSWNTNAQATGLTLPLTGTGTGTLISDPAVNTTTLLFSSQTAGITSTAQVVTLMNSSTGTLSQPGISISGSDATDFSITTSTCQSALAPNASCAVSVIFKPAAAGTRSATLNLTETNTTTTAQLNQSVFLLGTATEPALAATATIQFGNQAVGIASATQTVTLTNSSAASVAITGAALSGPSDFSIAGNSCGSVVSANSSCTVTLTFTPTTLGQEQATLQFTDQAGNSPQTVTIQGTGVSTPVLQFAGGSSPVNLGKTVLGGSAALNLAFSNTGQAAYSIAAITITGANASEFTATNGCGSAIATGSSCTVGISFKPRNIGIRTASLAIVGTGPEVAVTVGLNGTALGQFTVGGGDIRAGGDYDGDGKTDFAVWRPSSGTWYVIPSSHPGSVIAQQWGWPTDIPVPGDYDGDGKTDFAVWRPSTGAWYVIPSSHPGIIVAQQWGWPTDIPVPGDYDGDGKTDFAVWRPSTGAWYVIPSSHPGSVIAQQWGWPTDIPVPGDYNGDGKTDFAVWRPSSGSWYALTSTSVIGQQWGWPTDIPVPGDYNGDGKTDFAVWRPSSGSWYALTSTSVMAQQWGWPTDIPR